MENYASFRNQSEAESAAVADTIIKRINQAPRLETDEEKAQRVEKDREFLEDLRSKVKA
jgi:hypothetical protein